MTSLRMYVNDTDLASFGVVVNRPLGWLDAPPWQDSPVPVPGHAGGLLLSTEAQVATRTVTITGTLMAASAASARTQWDALKAHLSSPVLDVRFSTWADRFLRCRYQSLVASRPTAPDRGVPFTLSLLAANPHLLALQSDVYTALDGTDVIVAPGSAPGPAKLILVGLGTSHQPSVSYTDMQGVLRGSVGYILLDGAGLPRNLATTERIEVDTATMDMVLYTSLGGIENAANFWTLSSGGFDVDPADGDGVFGPVLRPSNCNLIAHVRKEYR